MEPDYKPGDPISAHMVNQMVRAQDRGQVRVSGAYGRQGMQGQTHLAIDRRRGPYLCQVSSTIAAMDPSDPDAPILGFGSVESGNVPPMKTLVDTGIEIKEVYNFSPSASYVTGAWVWVDYDENGDPYIVGAATQGAYYIDPSSVISGSTGTWPKPDAGHDDRRRLPGPGRIARQRWRPAPPSKIGMRPQQQARR